MQPLAHALPELRLVLHLALDLLRLGVARGPGPGRIVSVLGRAAIGAPCLRVGVARYEARFAFNIRTFNEQRLRHFTAIANSFEAKSPDP